MNRLTATFATEDSVGCCGLCLHHRPRGIGASAIAAAASRVGLQPLDRSGSAHPYRTNLVHYENGIGSQVSAGIRHLGTHQMDLAVGHAASARPQQHISWAAAWLPGSGANPQHPVGGLRLGGQAVLRQRQSTTRQSRYRRVPPTRAWSGRKFFPNGAGRANRSGSQWADSPAWDGSTSSSAASAAGPRAAQRRDSRGHRCR